MDISGFDIMGYILGVCWALGFPMGLTWTSKVPKKLPLSQMMGLEAIILGSMVAQEGIRTVMPRYMMWYT